MMLSVVLGVVGVTGQIVASRSAVAGWTISLAAQPLWYAFSITTGQYGLLFLNTGYAVAAVLNLRRALRERTATRGAGGGDNAKRPAPSRGTVRGASRSPAAQATRPDGPRQVHPPAR